MKKAISLLLLIPALALGAPGSAPAGEGAKPKILEVRVDSEDSDTFRFEILAKRAKDALVKLRALPPPGSTIEDSATIILSKEEGSHRRWIGFADKQRPVKCYRAKFLALNPHGRDKVTMKLCIFDDTA